ncbi:hypothetical protein KFL_000080390 [Klebsormidium nitens]|uniref:Uncharacterized protein n=1 Tax=Klebsormidium nitens TaxID=105231 RepID=A0A1Y1HI42_KLENI|nr:hypothetical protein KFL_000080390 [Klebsormidium nitens]|eukprot:GAQ78134.1 hypothetical protein KFL_000080390 [Klebsormidium nitens]
MKQNLETLRANQPRVEAKGQKGFYGSLHSQEATYSLLEAFEASVNMSNTLDQIRSKLQAPFPKPPSNPPVGGPISVMSPTPEANQDRLQLRIMKPSECKPRFLVVGRTKPG